MRKLLAIAAALAFILPTGSVFALSSSSNVSQTVTVLSLTVTGVPTSMAFGTMSPGATSQGSPDLSASVSTANPSGATTTITLGDFSDGASHTIAATNEQWAVNAGSYTTYSTPYVALTTSAPGTASFSSQVKLTIPAAQFGGNYTATATVATVTNP